MEVREDTLYLQLHKLSAVNSEEVLDALISTLWQTRKTGLRGHHDKSHFLSLLNLPSLSDLDPVLACLRSLIRKCAYDNNFTGDEILKLFPHDLPLHLQQILLILFQKYQSQWKEEVSTEQRSMPRTSVSYHVKMGDPPTVTTVPSSGVTAALWPRQDDRISQLYQNDVGAATPIISENNVSQIAPMAPQSHIGPSENLGILPRLKSMTWTMENCSSDQSKRVAVITLKLQDYTKSPTGEMEVKFQLTRDTLEAVLRSMTYINDQLSGTVGDSLEPMKKKQKQSENLA
ncbi:uncharacterized protein LOC21410600 [Morus notabilis]|uniref:uncharacterized protein LOC21410600 n=1 Tax=Morus notabilis TaxID=981085 RepID=UPI000CED658E|nr:uncharacterized protein LOC21410600 [Morus notabilis]